MAIPSPQTGVFCLDKQSLARQEIFAATAAKPIIILSHESR
jgi:hypothetical protein